VSSFLDRSITVRQIWRWTRRVVYIAIPLYIWAFLSSSWDLKMGGAIPSRSPVKELFPAQCEGYIARSHGYGAGRITSDDLLLRGRIWRSSLEPQLNGSSQLPQCFGYAVLAGMHDRNPGDANFTEQWLDESGDSVVTIHVEYNKPYLRIPGSK
jgi:hypothetical protein